MSLALKQIDDSQVQKRAETPWSRHNKFSLASLSLYPHTFPPLPSLFLYVKLVTIPGVNSIWQLTCRLTASQVTTGDPQIAPLPLLTSVLWAALMATWQAGDGCKQIPGNSRRRIICIIIFFFITCQGSGYFFFFWHVLLVSLADASLILILCWREEAQRDKKGFALVYGKAVKGWRKAEDHPPQWCQSVYKLWAQEAEAFKL